MAVVAGAPDKHNPVAGITWMLAAACCFAASLSLVKALQDGGMTVFQAVLFRQIFGLLIFAPVILKAGLVTLEIDGAAVVLGQQAAEQLLVDQV